MSLPVIIAGKNADGSSGLLRKINCSTWRRSVLLDRPSRICSGFPEHNSFLRPIWICSVSCQDCCSWLFPGGHLSNFHSVSGPDRAPSKRMLAQMRQDERELRKAIREGRAPPDGTAAGGNEEGYWAYMQRQVQERTERLGIVGDSMDRLEENSSNWANDVSKFVQTQKRKAVMGGKL